ncbi:glutathione peroxidase [Peptoniphilus sp. oral taxon 386]|uniref:glutathione peroxidase n=1 Tax=Peptoniphilus sp. oral taxon 386 TaxID=652713 RepID=UPI0001DA9C53|nr:glutathione peroxidase [Peptoniphilus sp. oral taxon 386]EFI42628.1 peroxiredoxin HYR1 [Peptoniphilus sp. oral taxon 386 str. F0131]
MIYDFKVKDTFGEEVSLREYDGYVMLIVNTASKCGFTPQFEGLELLYQKYKDKKFVIIGFPCNQFGNQDPGSNEEIRTFCSLNYGVSFPMMAKIDVNGENQAPLYKYLKSEKRGALLSSIKWNFTKFLIDRNGNVVERFAPTTTPEKLESEIENLL